MNVISANLAVLQLRAPLTDGLARDLGTIAVRNVVWTSTWSERPYMSPYRSPSTIAKYVPPPKRSALKTLWWKLQRLFNSPPRRFRTPCCGVPLGKARRWGAAKTLSYTAPLAGTVTDMGTGGLKEAPSCRPRETSSYHLR